MAVMVCREIVDGTAYEAYLDKPILSCITMVLQHLCYSSNTGFYGCVDLSRGG